MLVEFVLIGAASGAVAFIGDLTQDGYPRWFGLATRHSDKIIYQPVAGGFERLWCYRCDHVIARRRDDGFDYGHQLDDCQAEDARAADDDMLPTGPRLTLADFPNLTQIAEREELLEQLTAGVEGLKPEDLDELRALLAAAEVPS